MKTLNKIISSIKTRLLVILCSAFIAGCGGGGSSSGGGGVSTNTPAGVSSILVISDSIGLGTNAGGAAFPDLIRSMVSVPVTNNSQGGRQAAAGLSAARSLISSVQPSHIVVLLGTNDANNGSVSSAISSLRAIANLATANGITAVIGTLPPISRSSSQNARAAQISAGIRGISNARIAEIRGAMNSSHLASDGFHPNAAGQQIIASAFVSAL